MDYILQFKDWLLTMGKQYHVNAFVFGGIYLISKLFFFSFLGWTLNNIRKKKPIVLSLLLAAISFSMPYTYLVIAGRNLPVGVYIFIAALYLYGAYSIWSKVRRAV